MKTQFTQDEALSKLRESLATRMTQAVEAMTGTGQRCHTVTDVDIEVELRQKSPTLNWYSDYSAASGAQVRIFATEENWRLIGKTILEAAGVDEFDDPTLESTYTETLAQAASSWAQDLSGLAGKKWESAGSGNGGEIASNSPSWGYRLPMGDAEAAIYVQVSNELITALLQVPPQAEAPQSAAPVQEQPQAPSSQFDLLLDVELPVSVSFGRALVPLKEVLKLSSGSIVELNRAVTEPVEVIVNNCVIARGEVVVVEGNYGVRIQQIVSRQDRLRSVN